MCVTTLDYRLISKISGVERSTFSQKHQPSARLRYALTLIHALHLLIYNTNSHDSFEDRQCDNIYEIINNFSLSNFSNIL